jgi:hypothetical protein
MCFIDVGIHHYLGKKKITHTPCLGKSSDTTCDIPGTINITSKYTAQITGTSNTEKK